MTTTTTKNEDPMGVAHVLGLPTAIHAKLIKASNYYGRRAPGWVALVGGQPWHFHTKAEAQAAVDKAKETA